MTDDPHLSPTHPAHPAQLPALADQLHAAACANPKCPGRGAHEAATGTSYLAIAETNLDAGWVPPLAAGATSPEGTEVFAPGGAVVVSVKPTGRLEPKVLAATVWALLAPLLAAVCMWIVESPEALNALQSPPWVRSGVLTLAGALGALLGGFRAKHDTSRVRVTPVGDGLETTQVLPLGPDPVPESDAERTGELYLERYRHGAVTPAGSSSAER